MCGNKKIVSYNFLIISSNTCVALSYVFYYCTGSLMAYSQTSRCHMNRMNHGNDTASCA